MRGDKGDLITQSSTCKVRAQISNTNALLRQNHEAKCSNCPTPVITTKAVDFSHRNPPADPLPQQKIPDKDTKLSHLRPCILLSVNHQDKAWLWQAKADNATQLNPCVLKFKHQSQCKIFFRQNHKRKTQIAPHQQHRQFNSPTESSVISPQKIPASDPSHSAKHLGDR